MEFSPNFLVREPTSINFQIQENFERIYCKCRELYWGFLVQWFIFTVKKRFSEASFTQNPTFYADILLP